ncbi:MAG: sensor histidine kinase, partial [Ktedonobacterales bacterium]
MSKCENGRPEMETTNAARQLLKVPATWDRYKLLDLAAYITLVAGYLLGVLAAWQPLTLPVFLLFTAGNLLWLWLFHRIETCAEPDDVPLRYAIGLILVTCGVLATTQLGIQFDWLMPIVTIGVIGTIYALRHSLPLSTAMWLLTMLVLFLLNWPLSIAQNRAVFLQSFVSLAPAFIFCMGFALVLRREFEQRARGEALVAQLEAAQAQLRAHADEVEELAVVRERNRIAREIHDTLGHYLTILAVQLETALKLEERGDARLHGELAEARRVAAECLAEVRRSVAALRPADPTAVSFGAALEGLAREFETAQPETEIALDIEGTAQALPAEHRVTLYRCVQEALTNIRKHARATKVLVRLRVNEVAAELAVLDNGRGAE